MNQSFNRQQLLRFCKQAEYVDYGMNIRQLSEKLDDTYNLIADDKFEFEISQVGEYFLTHDLPNKLILRKLNDNIKRIYKDEQANRRIIIAQIKTLLGDTCPYWVVKTDIRNFYESINRERVIAKFHDDSMLSYQSMYLLNNIFKNNVFEGKTGVPRGMNISATLSEIYMRKFDKWLRGLDGIYYFARYVDDIIIFSNSLSKSIELIKMLDAKLSELAEGLRVNKFKTELFEGKTLKSVDQVNGKPLGKLKTLDYLGYTFRKEYGHTKTLSLKKFANVEGLKYTVGNQYSCFLSQTLSYVEFNAINNPKESLLIISIAEKKVKKIKTRIIKALLDYSKNRDFILLEKRIKFLTGNYSIKKSKEGNDLRAGIFYNYIQVNELKIFHELNSFFKKALFSKSKSFSAKISLTHNQKITLKKYCFVAGFKKKVHHEFSFIEMVDIIKCW